MKSKRQKSTSIKVDPDFWKMVKIEAIKNDMELSEFIEYAILQYLNRGY